jgi:hypothetical protein
MTFLSFLWDMAAVGFVLWLLWRLLKGTVSLLWYALFPHKTEVLGDFYPLRVSPKRYANGGVTFTLTDGADLRHTLTFMPDHQATLKPSLWENGPFGLWQVPASMEALPVQAVGADRVVLFPPHLYPASVVVYSQRLANGERMTYFSAEFRRKPTLLPQWGYERVAARGEF